jgi:hypothetical protein
MTSLMTSNSSAEDPEDNEEEPLCLLLLFDLEALRRRGVLGAVEEGELLDFC